MFDDRTMRRMKAGCAAIVLIAAGASLAGLDMPQASAQAMMRPNLNIQPRIPTVNPTIAPRIDPNVAARTNTVTGAGTTTPRVTPTTTSMRPRLNPNSTMPHVRYSPNLYPSCEAANRDANGECKGQPTASGDGGGTGKLAKGKGKGKGPNSPSTATVSLNFPNELVAEIDGSMSEEQVRAMAQRHGMVLVESQNLPLIGATIGLFRVTNGRPLDAARRAFAADGSVRDVYLNMRYLLQQARRSAEGDPAQYAVAKLKLPQAHKLAHGMNVTIAVIDSGIDASHPELTNSIADNFDALGSKEGAHVHGTGIAGAIAAHGRLMGSAPESRIIAIRAFASAQGQGGAESSSYVIIKSLNYAVLHGAQIINMSFAGPKDMLIERGIAATAARGVVLVAAAGNAGPKSPPLYPAANPNVIAVSGTDAQDRLFAASNRGVHIALAAPGTDIFLPAPDQKYQMTSGTSFSAAYVSGIVALLLERNPSLKPSEIRSILTATARDLGTPGKDELFGHGQADAFAAATAAIAAPAVPMAVAPRGTGAGTADNDVSVSRELKVPSAAMASDKSATNEPNRPAAQ